ncbi:hypothetical protein C1752_00517 [Acaryochloris thomasi RCC1774]|uniref:TIGR04376 family protein n=1 Tax=Acaryochloris thomasi RCC1774 TaxID=1764569 RepID=A0A2W1JYP4_9CYAN|nr:TIGR04376 family protein [Acaryochloris thomasi]PZD75345.1 hypothetical protein C1752_00517 [Acaryochloris thomasi RCC1774]
MSVFDDVSRFLEERLEEYLRAHPHLELQVLDDKLRDQAADTAKLLAQLQAEEQQQQKAILETANEIQRWHQRIKKAQQAGRKDLATAAEQREAALLRQGNQQWGQLEIIKERVAQTKELHQKIQVRRQEVQAKIRQAPKQQTARTAQTTGWYQKTSSGGASDPLEEQFQRWEMDDELDQLKRKMGR